MIASPRDVSAGAGVPDRDDLRADIIVIGAGPAGIAAAVSAAEAGRQVLLLDEGTLPGGQVWRHRSGASPPAARPWLARLARSRVAWLPGCTVVDLLALPDGAFSVLAESAGAPLRAQAPTLILATGARERFLPFPGWTLPGVIGVGAAHALLEAGASVAGKRIVIAGTGPLLLAVAASLARAGARIALLAEQAPRAELARFAMGLWRIPSQLLRAARYRAAFLRTPYRAGWWVVSAEGDDRVSRVTLTDGRKSINESCDLLCAGYGLVPNTELARLLGCVTLGGAVSVDDRRRTSVPGVLCAGEPTGIGGVDLALLEGRLAGLVAAQCEDDAALLAARLPRARAAAQRMEQAFAPRAELRSLASRGTLVCRCEDVRLDAIDPAWSARQAKLYSRAGMGPCQGRVCGPALEFIFGWTAGEVRPPVQPALLSTLGCEAPQHPAGSPSPRAF